MGKTNDRLTPGGNALSGALAGMFAVTMSYPFDLIKTRTHFAVGSGATDTSIRGVARSIYTEGAAVGGPFRGCLGFYRGIDQLMPEAAFKTMLRFFMFKELQDTYKRVMGVDQMTVAGNLLSGAMAGAIETTVVVQPFERGKTLKADFKKPSQVYGELYKSKGIGATLRSIYTGFLPCLGRQVGNQATAFTIFYGIKQYLTQQRGTSHLSLVESMGFGFLSGASACCVTMPMDVAKSIAQKQTGKDVQGTMSIMTNVVKTKGIGGLYAGLGPRIGRVGLDRAFGFFAFEFISEKLSYISTFQAAPEV